MDSLTKTENNIIYIYWIKKHKKKIINNFLFEGDKFMPEVNFEKRRVTYSKCGPFTKNKERIWKKMYLEDSGETGDSKYIYQNKLYKVCF